MTILGLVMSLVIPIRLAHGCQGSKTETPASLWSTPTWHSVLSTEQDLGTIKWEILVLILRNMKNKKVCGKMCVRHTFRTQSMTQNADALFTGRKHQVTSKSNVIFRYITWQRERDYEKVSICTCHGRSQCHRDRHDTIQGPNSSRHHLPSHNVIGDKTDHHTKASIKKAWHQRIREKGRVRTCQGTQTGCYSDDQKSYLGKGQATDPWWVP